jgi:type II secretory pathway pseudopilin PulG
LITLGIIGVVAAMTIPTLIANTNGAKFRSQFKKTLSTLNQAGLMAQAQYDFDYAGITSKCGNDPATENPTSVMSFCSLLNGTLTGQTYLGTVGDVYANVKTSSNVQTMYELFPEFNAYSLADGSIVAFSDAVDTSYPCTLKPGETLEEWFGYHPFCIGFIDVNGTTLPNTVIGGVVTSVSGVGGPGMGEEGGEIPGYDIETSTTVPNDAAHMTDIYPIIFHDATVEPGSGAARYVLSTAK